MVELVFVVLTTAKLVGGLGPELVVTGLDAVELDDLPCELVAVIVNVYDVLANKPVTTIGLDVP